MCTPDMPDCDNHDKVDGVVTSKAAANRVIEHGLGAQCPGAFARCAITGNNLMGSPENPATATQKTVTTDDGSTVVVQVSMNAKWKDLGPFWRYIPDQSVGMNIWKCEGCPNRWTQADKTGNYLGWATLAVAGAIPAIEAAPVAANAYYGAQETAGNIAVRVIVEAESRGIPATALAKAGLGLLINMKGGALNEFLREVGELRKR
jgi:hypothetical protein